MWAAAALGLGAARPPGPRSKTTDPAQGEEPGRRSPWLQLRRIAPQQAGMNGAELVAEHDAARVADRSGEERREQPDGALGIALPAGFRTAAPSALPEYEGAGEPVLVEQYPGRCGRTP